MSADRGEPARAPAPAETGIDLTTMSADSRFRRLYDVTVALAETLTFDEVLDVVGERGLAAADAQAGVIALLIDDELRIVRAAGYGTDLVGSDAAVHGHESPLVRAIERRNPELVTRIDADDHVVGPLVQAARDAGHRSLVALPILVAGAPIGALAASFAAHQTFDDAQLELYRAIAHHGGLAIERARLVDAERAATQDAQRARVEADGARHEAERARDDLGFLVSVGRAVSDTLDHTLIMQRVLDLAVPRVADAGLGYLPEAGGLRRVAITHREPRALELGRRHVLGSTISVEGQTPAAQCFRTGEIKIQRDLDRQNMSRSPEYLQRTVSDYGLRCWVCVPIQAGAEVLGVLSLGFNDADAVTDEDVGLALEMAGRTAPGLVNAALFEHEREVASSLQRTVLPDVLPEVDELDIAARYLPSQAEMRVGGDWYDAFRLPDGTIGVTVGDVSGHGLGVGATMGQLRNALRAYAFEGHGPGAVVDLLNRLLGQTPRDEFASVVYTVFEPTSGRLRWASAGHPPMILLPADGPSRPVADPHGVLLGAIEDARCPVGNLTLGPGDSLLLYTDGLVEQRGEHIDDSIGRLCAVLDEHHGRAVDGLCDLALAPLVARGPRLDDVCLLAVRRRPELEDPAGSARDDGPGVAEG